MSLLNRISVKALCLALPAGVLAAACGAQGPEGDSVEASAPATAVTVERIEIGDGAHVEFSHDKENGLMAVTAIGPEAAKERIAKLGEVKGGLAEVYRAALPGRDVPQNILAFDAASREIVTDALAERAESSFAEEANPSEDENLGSVSKSAASFPGAFCGRDKIDDLCNNSGWYYMSNGCFVNSTNNWSRQLNSVRQGYAALEVYRGSVTLRSEWWNGSAWVLDKNTVVNQGGSAWRRLWSTTTYPHTLRFGAADATGDGYHIGIQSSDTPIQEMTNKNVDPPPPPGQRFNIVCNCIDQTTLRPNGTYRIQACLSTPTGILAGKEFPTHGQADVSCGFRCDEATIVNGVDSNRTSFEAVPGTIGCKPNPASYIKR